MPTTSQPYLIAQTAIAQLKAAIHMVLRDAPPGGLKNADIGRLLGIYMGHIQHVGHIPRVLLAAMEAEGVVVQNQSTKHWQLRSVE